jgi:hypothetical protein
MFIADLAYLQWEIMELRRMKATLIRSTSYETLYDYLLEELDSDGSIYEKYFERALKQAIEENIDEADADADGIVPKLLAQQCVHYEPGAKEKADRILKAAGQSTFSISNDTRGNKSEDLARSCVLGKPTAIKQVNQVLGRHGLTIHDLIDEPLLEMDVFDRINRLTIRAETLCNATLREIDRRRARLGASLRRTLEAEDATLEVVATSPETKNAA